MSDPAARALRELAEARAEHEAILAGTVPTPTVPMLQSEMGKIIAKEQSRMEAVPPLVERTIAKIRDGAVERDRVAPAPRQRMVADVSSPPPAVTRHPRMVRTATPAPKPPPRTPATAPPAPAYAPPPVLRASLVDTVRDALVDRLRTRMMEMKPETLLMAFTIAEMLEAE
jgi:hypothetical protein